MTQVESPGIDTKSCFPTNPEIFKLGTRKEHVLAHEIGAGSLCRNDCNCPGLDLHFWRKMCKACGCRMDEHDVQLPHQYDHGEIVVGRLFGVRDHFEGQHTIPTMNLRHVEYGEQRTQKADKLERAIPTAVYNFSCESEKENVKTTTEYAWVPIPNKDVIEKYMNSLAVEDRPILGSTGEQNRKSRLQFQLPLYDCNIEDARFVNEKDIGVLKKFVDNVKANVIGVGTVVELPTKEELEDPEVRLRNAMNDMTLGNRKSDCRTCRKSMANSNVGVTTDHSHKEELWHPGCFRCAKCDQLLVDMIYFFHEGKYFCGRHYADLHYPRCSGCDELIFANEYTFAEELPWHFDHFACLKCDLKLGGHRYMMKEEQPHCLPCYIEHYAKTCEACQKKIGPDEKRLNYKEFHWHADATCFHCANCQKDLIGQRFIMKQPHVFCSSNCKSQYGSS